MANEEIIQQIMEADLRVLYNMLEPLKNKTKKLKRAYHKLKYGVNIKYHIKWNLKEHFKERAKDGNILLNDSMHKIESWWDEEEDRRAVARRALLEYFAENEQPFTNK